MSLVCKTLVLVEDSETLKIIAKAFPFPKYELQFVDTLEEADAQSLLSRMDLFIADSKFAEDSRLKSIRHGVPTLFVEPDYMQIRHPAGEDGEESDRLRLAAEKLLRKNYINWIVDALEYSS